MRLIGFLLVSLSAPAAGQEGDVPERLRRQVMERFLTNYRQHAALTEDQFRQFRDVAIGSGTERRQLEQRERQLAQTLQGQLRPGVAADVDSVEAILDAMLALQQARVDLRRREQEQYAQFLSPVQRAQLVMMTARFERQIQEIMRRRMEQRRRQ